MDTEAMQVLPAPVKRNLNVLMELSDGGLTGNQQATPDDGADPGQYQAQLVNRSRQTKFGHHLRLPDLVCSLNAPGIECSPSRKMHRTPTERPGYRREPSDLHSGPP